MIANEQSPTARAALATIQSRADEARPDTAATGGEVGFTMTQQHLRAFRATDAGIAGCPAGRILPRPIFCALPRATDNSRQGCL
jgi:hypothetical protein